MYKSISVLKINLFAHHKHLALFFTIIILFEAFIRSSHYKAVDYYIEQQYNIFIFCTEYLIFDLQIEQQGLIVLVCTFFGHRTAPGSIRPILHNTLIDLIENQGVHTFYVGNQGGFDSMVKKELKELAEVYPHIKYSVILAYMPGKRDEFDTDDYSDTMYPDGLESVPLRFAIYKRNRMIIEWSDIVVTYVCYSSGGAAKFKEIAEKKGKQV